MASSNDSQGLKIAVAIFVSLTVILAVTAYFMYSEYSKASEQLAAAQAEVTSKNQAASTALNNFRNLRDRAGYEQLSDAGVVMDAITKDQQALLDELEAAFQEASAAIADARQAGASAEAVERANRNLNEVIQRVRQESAGNPTFRGTIDALGDLTIAQTRLSAELAMDNALVRNELEQSNQVNQGALGEQRQAAQDATDLRRQERDQFDNISDQMRGELAQNRVQINDLRTERDELQRRLRSTEQNYEEQVAELSDQRDYWRNLVEKDEVVLDVADGYITFVDYNTNQVRTNLTRSMGARPQMIFSVFDENAPGLPSDEPKARLKLLDVNERGSVASIEELFDKAEPIRRGDQVYSAAWSPTDPLRFALIGKMDIDRDGRDDREDLKRLIRQAGGVIDYDLPPPGYGQEEGEMTGKTTWYVVDEREPIRTPNNQREIQSMESAAGEFATQRTEATDEAMRLGIRPIRIERLLSSLGYTYGMTISGQVEARDDAAIERLLNPEGRGAPAPDSGDDQPTNGRDDQSGDNLDDIFGGF